MLISTQADWTRVVSLTLPCCLVSKASISRLQVNLQPAHSTESTALFQHQANSYLYENRVGSSDYDYI